MRRGDSISPARRRRPGGGWGFGRRRRQQGGGCRRCPRRGGGGEGAAGFPIDGGSADGAVPAREASRRHSGGESRGGGPPIILSSLSSRLVSSRLVSTTFVPHQVRIETDETRIQRPDRERRGVHVALLGCRLRGRGRQNRGCRGNLEEIRHRHEGERKGGKGKERTMLYNIVGCNVYIDYYYFASRRVASRRVASRCGVVVVEGCCVVARSLDIHYALYNMTMS